MTDRLFTGSRLHALALTAGKTLAAAALDFAEAMAARMRSPGLGQTRIERLTDLSPMAVCVIGSAAI